MTPDRAFRKLEELIGEISSLRQKQGHDEDVRLWLHELFRFMADVYGANSRESQYILSISLKPNFRSSSSEIRETFQNGLSAIEKYLRIRLKDIAEQATELAARQQAIAPDSRRVFLVHGHEESSKQAVARFLEKLALEAIILHEKPGKGQTIIEKFVLYSDVACAVVLMTPDDVGNSKVDKEQRPHARQNVIFEMGFFIGKLGRDKVFVLLTPKVEKPGDYDGVNYIAFDSTDSWKMSLFKELQACGLELDAQRAFGTQ